MCVVTRGGRIKQLMWENNIDVKELAQSCDKTAQYIYQILKDEIESPGIGTLKIIARKFDVSLDYLEGGTESQKEIVYLEGESVLKHLPKHLQDFVRAEENTPYILFSRELSSYDLNCITIDDMYTLIKFLKLLR